MENRTITAVPGIRAGHANHVAGGTGCTVVLGPFRGACDVRGQATGTRELDALTPTHLVPQADAILLTGGSAFGLSAADGVMRWVAEQGGGFQTDVARVPIVPAAVIFDLDASRTAPDAALGFTACANATDAPVEQGRIGAGTGATIGKIRGREFAQPGGVGTFAMKCGPYTMGALVVVNAVGDVLDFDGRIVAGARDEHGAFIDTLKTLSSMNSLEAPGATNTTLAIVATDAPLTRIALQSLARVAGCGIVRRISPANTIFDGDVVFAVSTAESARDVSPADLLGFSAAAQLTVEHAILNAVTHDTAK